MQCKCSLILKGNLSKFKKSQKYLKIKLLTEFVTKKSDFVSKRPFRSYDAALCIKVVSYSFKDLYQVMDSNFDDKKLLCKNLRICSKTF